MNILLNCPCYRLYWVDAKLHSVSSSNIDGSDSRIVLYSHRYLNHPFSITVFEVGDGIYKRCRLRIFYAEFR